ncbi:hypothetical protein J6590_094419 [Homalodisca vitripennis]|nr:hypothetical protein J6590_094419 [Homalodisca vitripennis]
MEGERGMDGERLERDRERGRGIEIEREKDGDRVVQRGRWTEGKVIEREIEREVKRVVERGIWGDRMWGGVGRGRGRENSDFLKAQRGTNDSKHNQHTLVGGNVTTEVVSRFYRCFIREVL